MSGLVRLLAFLTLTVPAAVLGQAFPSKPLRWIVPYPPGGSFDAFTRIVGAQMSLRLGQPIVVENRIGAGGIIGTEAGARSAPDGYTLVAGDNGTLIYNTFLYRKLPYDPERDLLPIGVYARVPLFITAGEATGLRSLKQLIEKARVAPGQITYASSGTGSPQHLAVELLKRRAGIDLLHVPYKGSGLAMQDLLAGRVDISVMTLGALKASGGKLRPLANTDEKRMSALPNIPTVAEEGLSDYQAIAWWMMLVPAGTPKEVATRLSEALRNALAVNEVVSRSVDYGAEAPAATPEEANELIRRERAVWAPLISSLGLVLD